MKSSNSSKNGEKMILVSVFYDLFLSTYTTTTITINATQSVPRIFVYFFVCKYLHPILHAAFFSISP